MRKAMVLFAVVFLSYHPGFAQEILKSGNAFQFDVDVARFYGDDSTVYVEMYYGVRENVFSYRVESNTFVGGINMRLEVWRDSTLASKNEWSIPHILSDTSQLRAGKTLVGIHTSGFVPGKYFLKIFGHDILDVGRRDSLVVSLPVTAYPNDKTVLSDIELATTIASSSNKESMFYKNTLEVAPNPSRLYGASVPFVYYYVECYDMSNDPKRGNMKVITTVTDANDKEVARFDKTKSRSVQSSVIVDKVNVSTFSGGTYELRVTLEDSLNRLFATSKKKFFIYKPGTFSSPRSAISSAELLASEYVVMTEDELDKEFAQARFISVDAEREKYAQLKGVASKRKFLFEFWRQREIDPNAGQMSFKSEYMKRVEFANTKFSLGIRVGWKTDRGRAAILYGIPDAVERFPSSSESNPYEIWHYNNIQGGVMFVFVDKTGFGEFLLVHSTHRSEMQDNNWFQHYAQKMQ